MYNPLQMNDWGMKNFLIVIFAFQIALLGIICSDAIDLHMPIVRHLIGLIYLIFIPGIIILRILRLHRLGNIDTVLFAVGLSISSVMFIGALANTIYPLLGISQPISILSLAITMGAVVLVLCIICYIRDKDFKDPHFVDYKSALLPSTLFLILIPLMSIFGTYAVNFYGMDLILTLTVLVISLVAVLIILDVFIPLGIYPFAIFLFSISLLFHKSLISMYIWGWDINFELFFTKQVIENSIWDPSLSHPCNSMLSLVMIAPIYSIISGLSLIWIFKIVYPIIFSLVPLGLYRVFCSQTNEKLAFASCIFFIGINTFYTEMLQLARQQIAELFLVLLIVLIIDKNMDKIKRSFLVVIFSMSIAVSHYGLSYILMLSITVIWVTFVILENSNIRNIINSLLPIFRIKNKTLIYNSTMNDRIIDSFFVLLFITFALTWYISTSDSSTFDSIALIGNQISRSIYSDFLNPDYVQGIKMITAKAPSGIFHNVNTAILYLNQIFIVIGGIALLLPIYSMKFQREYIAFSIVGLGLCFAGVSIPFFASSLQMTRLYHITLFFLAPICLIGGITFLRGIAKILNITWTDRLMANSVKIMSIYVVVFLLYQSGVIFELTEGSSTSIAFNTTIDYPQFNEKEITGAMWLNNVRDNKINQTTFADGYRWLLLSGIAWNQYNTSQASAQYVYMGTFNILKGDIISSDLSSYIKYHPISRDLIYSNGGALIYC